jgi:hypothetical protein
MSALSLSRFLRKRMVALKLSNAEVAKRANISRPTWYRLLNADVGEAKLTTIVKLAAALETHPMVLLRLYFSKSTFSAAHNIHTRAGGGFIADITYPVNSLVVLGEVFTKVWRVVNLDRQSWKGLYLQCIDNQYSNGKANAFLLQPQLAKIPVPEIPPGGETELSVVFQAPEYPCTVVSEWKLADKEGVIKDSSLGVLRCVVKVVSL